LAAALSRARAVRVLIPSPRRMASDGWSAGDSFVDSPGFFVLIDGLPPAVRPGHPHEVQHQAGT